MSNRPTTPPSSSTTGRCLKWFSTIVVMASMAESDMDTHVGFGVITSETQVWEAFICLATSLLVISVSVMMPARPPSSVTIREASPLLLANICVTDKTLSLAEEIKGFLGLSLETGLSSSRVCSFLAFCFLEDLLYFSVPDFDVFTDVISDTSSVPLPPVFLE